MQHNLTNKPADGMSAEQVFNSNLHKTVKIIFLWQITQANYRLPEGDKAWDYIRTITDLETMEALAAITGMAWYGFRDA